ncbi:hypothetical protein CFC21_091355 [Triticum aestivum]|uniref:Cathepsin propeptide inhibitor domain-containing protein n=4 Tax=Triticinae TaxID=1648030 RepID=A0A9R1MSY3_WHEAT|nr:uncharacterized protein LOC109766484 [Aegilops tauschii subsp. strangulata]XP_044418246.1 uncharacterized protein LOC123143394 [Triticum aestivum]KAF7088225.1 hypothetical protein CFC21_091355 [Triticum aestivum]
MSPLRFLAAGRLSSRRIRGGGPARRLLHRSGNHADGARGSGFSARFPMGGSNKLRASVAAVGALSAALIGAKLYLRKHRKQPISESSGWELTDKDAATLEEQDLEKEAAMKARFEEWMVKYERRYKSEEEKAMPYREFKRHCKNAERANMLSRGGATFGPNNLADLTEEEGLCRSGGECEPTFAHRLGYPYRRAVEWWVLGK